MRPGGLLGGCGTEGIPTTVPATTRKIRIDEPDDLRDVMLGADGLLGVRPTGADQLSELQLHSPGLRGMKHDVHVIHRDLDVRGEGLVVRSHPRTENLKHHRVRRTARQRRDQGVEIESRSAGQCDAFRDHNLSGEVDQLVDDLRGLT